MKTIKPLDTVITKYDVYVKYLLCNDDGVKMPCHIHFNIMDKN